MHFRGFVFVVLSSLGVIGCRTDYAELPTFSPEKKLLQAVIEVPAGTNKEQAYDPKTKEFKPVQRAGTDRMVEFLPFPGNYGFIPGTRLEPAPGVAARPLPILVLAESQPSGTVMDVQPVGLVLLDNVGVMEQIVLAVPARPSQRILPDITTWADLTHRYPAAKEVLRLWFQHRGRSGEVHIMGWKDEKEAERRIKAAMQ
ncbi:inorganic diphosphatase [Hymenobacter sp. BT491]|uniref:inorganic diphosphatase n=1 Tax=Hymenobacter sp. BT491 TaxID=2766779 RepID=UPI001653C856|nr:inorganic diphosphatase [Hymenobacter sp. BT491]MBC6990622.1 inorganic diphosphatase [Hymenobacter sp. BT491]